MLVTIDLYYMIINVIFCLFSLLLLYGNTPNRPPDNNLLSTFTVSLIVQGKIDFSNKISQQCVHTFVDCLQKLMALWKKKNQPSMGNYHFFFIVYLAANKNSKQLQNGNFYFITHNMRVFDSSCHINFIVFEILILSLIITSYSKNHYIYFLNYQRTLRVYNIQLKINFCSIYSDYLS